MIVTTTNEIAGQSITGYLGVVRGIIVRNLRGLFVDLLVNAQECDEARCHAFDRMIAHAQQLGADAIIGMRFESANYGEQRTEVLAYGTAVKLAVVGTPAKAEPTNVPGEPMFIR
jgi:uncharacterized protein YbjQ (UPF0145 family)